MAGLDKKRNAAIESMNSELCKSLENSPNLQEMLPPEVYSNLGKMSKALRTPEAFIR